MTSVLFVSGCVDRGRSRTQRLAEALIARLDADRVDEIILEEAKLAPLDTERLRRRSELASRGDFGDPEFAEARRYASADILVFATPFWEHGFNSMAKIYLENVSQLGVSFVYGDDGVPQGLAKMSRAYYVTTRGGFTDDSHDLGYMMFREILGMHGVRDIRILSASALDIAGNDSEAIVSDAIDRIGSIIGRCLPPSEEIHVPVFCQAGIEAGDGL